MKILFLCKRYYTNKDLLLDRFGRLFHLPIELTRLGERASVIALDYRHSQARRECLEGVEFQTLPATVSRLPRLVGRLWDLIGDFMPDVIIASGDSHIGYCASRIASKIGAAFVFDVYDYYPAFTGNRIPGMRAMFETSVRRADIVLCASQPLLSRLKSTARHVVLIENGVDRRMFTPMDRHAARASLGLPREGTLVGYFGSITPSRGPLLFEAVRELAPEFHGTRVLLAGSVHGTSIANPDIIYQGELPQSAVPELIAACDVVTVPYSRDDFNDMAGPCKIAEYLACERPVVATRIAGQAAWFRSAPASLCEPVASDFARAISSQLRRPEIARFPEQLEWRYIARRLQRALQEHGHGLGQSTV